MNIPRDILEKIRDWRDIEGHPGYKVSRLGEYLSLNYMRTGKPGFIKPCNVGNGRLQISLGANSMNNSVARIVAQTFIPNPDNLPEVNHIDENPSNNCVWNLEWCDRKYNENYGTKRQRGAETFKRNWANKSEEEKQAYRDKIGKIVKAGYESGDRVPWNKGKQHSEKTRQKISKALKGREMSEEWRRKKSEAQFGAKNHKAKAVYMLDRDTEEIIQPFDCVADACRYLGLNVKSAKGSISKCARGKQPTAYGYKWKYIEE